MGSALRNQVDRVPDDVCPPRGGVLSGAAEVVPNLPPTVRAVVVAWKIDDYLYPLVVEVVVGSGGVELAGRGDRVVVGRVQRHPVVVDRRTSVQPAGGDLDASRTEDLHDVAHVVLGVTGVKQFDHECLTGVRPGYLGEPELGAGAGKVVVQRDVAEAVDLAAGCPNRVPVQAGVVSSGGLLQ